MDRLEERTVSRPDHSDMLKIQRLKQDLMQTRRAIWPQRELSPACARAKGASPSNMPEFG